jgi:hypothetical protein
MAAIVRSGARRLAGSAVLQRAPAAGAVLQPKPVAGAMLQRTQALGVDALRRPFLARFMSSKVNVQNRLFFSCLDVNVAVISSA